MSSGSITALETLEAPQVAAVSSSVPPLAVAGGTAEVFGTGPLLAITPALPCSAPSSGMVSSPSTLEAGSAEIAPTVSMEVRAGWNSERSCQLRRTTLWGEIKNNNTCFGLLEEDPRFQHTTLMVIVVNALWIFVDTQFNHKSLARPYPDGKLPLEPYSIVIENIFCVYFTMEVVVRFLAFRRKLMCFKDAWFVFDTTLVTLMILETWVMPIVGIFSSSSSGSGATNTAAFSSMRLLRLLRLTRMARLMRFFPELMTLVKGMISATQAVGFILLFLIMVTYVFAILFTVQLGTPPSQEGAAGEEDPDADPTAPEMFADLGCSMMTLFTNGVLGDNLYQTLVTIRDESVLLMWIFILFFFISSMTLLNMLIGVLCAVIEDTAREEAEARMLHDLQTTLRKAFDAVDSSRDGTICRAEWAEIRNLPEVRNMFKGLGIEPSQLEPRLDQLQETVFGRMRTTAMEQGSPDANKVFLSFEDFMERVIDLKWDTPANALDLEMLKSQVKHHDKEVRTRLAHVERTMHMAMEQMRSGHKVAPKDHPPTAVSVSIAASAFSDCARPLQEMTSGSHGPPEWLREVPTELLFHVLKTRSPPHD